MASSLPAEDLAARGQPRRRFVADAVVTVDAAERVLCPGAIDVVEERIVWVGDPRHAPHGAPPDVEVRVGGLLMPGLVNTHGHSAMTLLRGAGDGLPLARWLTDVIWPREARIDEEDVRAATALGCLELLRCGVTTTCEQYFFPRAVAASALETGVRCVVAPAIFDLPDAGEGARWRDLLDEVGVLHADLDGKTGRISVGVGPHSAYALSEDALVGVAKTAAALDCTMTIHVAETLTEGDAIRERTGLSVPELLDRLGVLDCRVLASHSVWLSDTDVDLFARHDVAVAHCPQSNAKLGSGVAPLAELLARGVRVGLGTDGPASNDNLDLWEEMRLAPLLARASARDPGVVSTAQALQLATRGGADALALECGSLEAGRLADFVRVELDDAAFTPSSQGSDLLAHLVWAASSRLVTDVWVGGSQVVAGGVATRLDEADVRAEVDARARALTAD